MSGNKDTYSGYLQEGYEPEKARPVQYAFSFSGLGEKFPLLKEKLDKINVVMPVHPSVSVKKTMGVIHGTIGEGTEFSMDFWIQKIGRDEALGHWDNKFISNPSIIKQIGLKKINTPVGKYRTLLPWKKQQQEDIITFYQARDEVRTAGRQSGSEKMAARPLVTVSSATPKYLQDLYKLHGFTEDYSGPSHIPTMLGGDIGER